MSDITITVVYAPKAREVTAQTLSLPAGSTVLLGLQASHVLQSFPEIDLDDEEAYSVGVWSRKAPPSQVLRHLDRIEIYRALTVDPKVARRERFQSQGTHRAGLFSKRRPGAKPGY